MSKARRKQFLVAGLGLFGTSVAVTLQGLGYDVYALDSDESIVQDLSMQLPYVVCGDASDKKTLQSLPLEDVDVAVVAIGNVERNMMATMLLKELGIKQVVSKAINSLHGAMLSKIGADKVIFAERDMGERLAHNLISAGVMDYIELSSEISVMSLPIPTEFIGKNLIEADLRRRYDVNVVAIKRDGRTIVNPKAQEVFQPEDEIIVLGTHEGVKRMGVDF
ncbi:TrkA family potassium uptake protein [Phascolarctobacterium sp.]|uniref:potassium channel family protein n=1 Tax=Phascolarctobacterium sp. TaxID=2049039 RepID=UPI002A84102A|nr:TrkA family potassium uptake protein [Phascolarctobacterium sp.]MDY5045444.1 TrkA family potassium uptake protein [Phascolarctobacterium sp.]